MGDERMVKLEEEVGSLQNGQERLFRELRELMVNMNERFDHLSVNRHNGGRGPGPTGVGPSNNQGTYIPRLVKLNFLRFDGSEDPTSWLCRVGQFFDFHNTQEVDHVTLASFHLEGEAQMWYQLFKEDQTEVHWEAFKEGLLARYGPTQFEDFFGDLTKLKQLGTVHDYHTQFEHLLSRAGKLAQVQQVGCFVSGLNEGIRADVQACRPTSLTSAVGLARLYEAKLKTQRKWQPLEARKTPTQINQGPTRLTTSAFKKMTPAELQDRRNRGLCFHCDERFTPGHHCKKLFIIEGCWPEDESGNKEEGEEVTATPVERTTRRRSQKSLSMPSVVLQLHRQCE